MPQDCYGSFTVLVDTCIGTVTWSILYGVYYSEDKLNDCDSS